jgi:opacity protein-like surface antigen
MSMFFEKMYRAGLSALFFVTIASAAHAQTDVALSLYGAFNGTTSGNGVTQSPANQAGGMIELRHIVNPLVGYEATYSYNRANQTYSNPLMVCPVGVARCTSPPVSVSANAHEIAGDWVVSFGLANLKPFALAGVGVLMNVPAGSQSGTSTSTKPVFVYGAGLDWGLLPHLGLRLQYRGNLHKAPDLVNAFQSTNAFMQTAEPMIGAYFRF